MLTVLLADIREHDFVLLQRLSRSPSWQSSHTMPMPSKMSRPIQPPAKPVGQKASRSGKTFKTARVPAVARRGRLTLQQFKHAVDTALRGQTFEAGAHG